MCPEVRGDQLVAPYLWYRLMGCLPKDPRQRHRKVSSPHIARLIRASLLSVSLVRSCPGRASPIARKQESEAPVQQAIRQVRPPHALLPRPACTRFSAGRSTPMLTPCWLALQASLASALAWSAPSAAWAEEVGTFPPFPLRLASRHDADLMQASNPSIDSPVCELAGGSGGALAQSLCRPYSD